MQAALNIFKSTVIPVILLFSSIGLQAQYEDHENLPVDEFRQKIEFSYPKDGKTGRATIKSNTVDYENGNENGEPEAGHGEGEVVIEADPRLDKMLTMSRNMDSGEMMEGYRVQIYAGGNLKIANETRADFIEVYSDIPSYRLWVQPTFRIRVGDFVNRNSANIFCAELRKHFPGAFVVPDKVKKPSLKRNRDFEEEEEDTDANGEGKPDPEGQN